MKKIVSGVVPVLFLASLWTGVAAAADVEVVVDRALGQKVMDAVDFPFQLQFPTALDAEGMIDDSLGEVEVPADIAVERQAVPAELSETDELGPVLEGAINEALEARKRGELDESQLTLEERQALDILERSATRQELNKGFFKKGGGDEVAKALRLLIEKKRTKVELIWLKFRIPERPRLTVGNPILVTDISSRTQVKVKGCVLFAGKWWCARVTTPWIRVDGRQLLLELSSKAAVVNAMPRFKDLDIVVTIRVFGWSIKIPVGVTTIVNRELRKRGPVKIMDLSAFEQDVPYSGKKAAIESVQFVADPRGLVVKAMMSVK